jgi:NADH dehydrogenase
VLPIVGGETLFQPAYVDDVAAAVVAGVTGSHSGTYELGGPDVQSLSDLMQRMLDVIGRRRLVMNLPFWAGRMMAFFGGIGQTLSLGIVKSPITADQVRSLAYDNVVSKDAKGFADLGIEPVSMEAVLPDYLWRFRPSGQYAAIKDSAKNLKV